jgi:hypothetical protein
LTGNFVIRVFDLRHYSTMKASIEKLRRLTSHSHKVDVKEKGDVMATTQIDELDRAGKVTQLTLTSKIYRNLMFIRSWVLLRNRRDFSRVYAL